jgi:hypothetical protein
LLDPARPLLKAACPLFGRAKALFHPARPLLKPAKALFEPAASLLDPASGLFGPAEPLFEAAGAWLNPAGALFDPARALRETGKPLLRWPDQLPRASSRMICVHMVPQAAAAHEWNICATMQPCGF